MQACARRCHAKRSADEDAAAAELLALDEEREKEEALARLLNCLRHGDCRELIPEHCPLPVRLLLTDPPYGKQYQSQRRTVTKREEAMTGDDVSAVKLLDAMLDVMRPKLADDAHLFVFTHQDTYKAFSAVLSNQGFTLRRPARCVGRV